MEGLVTLFVDYLPEDVGAIWFRSIFSKFGVVKESFIPLKRSKNSGCRFGFVKFARRQDADLAISNLNGVWIDNRRLLVKSASFAKKGSEMSSQFHSQPAKRPFNSLDQVQRGPVSNDLMNIAPRSFAQVVKQKVGIQPNKLEEKSRVSIDVQPQGFDWLSRSAVVKLKSPASSDHVSKALKCIDCEDVLIRSLGGLYLILAFQDKVERDKLVANTDIADWFDYLKPWNGEASSHSRLVWINCRGMPLNAWYSNTFKKIGELWGEFLGLDEDTHNEKSFEVGKMMILTDKDTSIDDWINIRVGDRNYEVKVWEEDCEEPFGEESKTFFHFVDDSHPELSTQDSGFLDDVVDDVEETFVCESLEDGEMEVKPQVKVAMEKALVLGDSVQVGEKEKIDANDVNETVMYDSLEEGEMEVKSQVKKALENSLDLGVISPSEAIASSCGLVEANGGSNEVNSNSLPGLDLLVGLESLVVESFAQSFQGQIDIEVLEESPEFVSKVVEESMDEMADPLENVADPVEDLVDDDDCTSLDLVSADPLIKYVDHKRHKKKKRTKQGVRRKSIPLGRYNPLKSSLLSRTHNMDKLEHNSRRFKLGSKTVRGSDQSLSLPMTQEQVGGFEIRLEEEILAAKTTEKILNINLLPGDEAILKDMIEADVKRSLSIAYSLSAK